MMKTDLTMDAATRNATAVEAAHWGPPMAPLDMPRQVLERRAAPAPQRAGLLQGVVARLSGALRTA